MIPNVLNAEIFKFQILAKRKKNVSNNAYRPYKVLTLTTYSKIAHACVRKSWCIHILAEAPWGDFSLSYSDGEKREVFCTIVFSQLAVTSIKKLFSIQKTPLFSTMLSRVLQGDWLIPVPVCLIHIHFHRCERFCILPVA
jgi:hypothetical protein